MIKQKQGTCIDCKDGKQVPLIAKRCQRHYWEYRAKIKGQKTDEKPKRYIIPNETEKRANELSIYAKMRIKYLTENPICKAHGILSGCTKKATDIHHKKGKIGKLLIMLSNLLGLCRSCHRWVTDNSKEAIELGLSEKRNTAINEH